MSASAGARLLVAVNYGATQGQCMVHPVFGDVEGRAWLLHDLLDPTIRYERDGDKLAHRGLYVDMPAWGHHVFEVIALA